ncbi:MAG: redoxin family protein [Flavobacterium circumlabens]|uniref:TlpA family protein disulfide reductase n=1 Tax=Flavobacterium circumlabens TaxID=2133765 RepID=UPI003266999A
MKIYYAFLFISFCTVVNAQIVKVEGEFVEAKDSVEITFNKSVDLDNKNYWMNADKTLIKNNKFSREFNFSTSGTITINNSAYTPKTELIVDKDSKIKILFKKDSGVFKVGFEGTNAVGLQELNSSAMFRYKTLMPIITEFFNESASVSQFFEKISTFQLQTIKKFDLLYQEHKISESFYSIVRKETELALLFVINDKVRALKEDTDLINQSKWPDKDLNEIIVQADKMYNAFDKKYNECNGAHRVVVIEQKCYNISKGILEQKFKNELGLWKKELDYYSYAPSDSQELMITNNINFLGFEKSNCSLEKFKKIFPKSPYLSVLKKLDDEFNRSQLAPYTLMHYSSASDDVAVISTTKYEGIKDLIAKNFPNKAVFVDLWATYCAPCKAEFSYSEELRDFLETKNIVMLYVSVDSREFNQKWQHDISQFKLSGNHYFATYEELDSLKKLLDEKVVAIPRYLLFNQKGELVLKNTEKPSTGKKLYSQITRELQ